MTAAATQTAQIERSEEQARSSESRTPEHSKPAEGMADQKAEKVEGGSDIETSHGEQTAKLAYFYWEARGGMDGSAEEDWFRAEAELAGIPADQSIRATHT